MSDKSDYWKELERIDYWLKHIQNDLNTLGEILQSAHLERSATQNDADTPSGAGRADSIPSGGGVATITAPEISPKTTDEAEAMARADLGLTEEDD